MANKGLSMRKVREVLRLRHVAGLSGRAIARSLKLSPTTVKRYIGRAEEAGLSWPLPESLDDAQLERRLLPGAVSMPGETRFAVPEWSRVHRELRRKGVTLALLWQEYKEAHPEGMQYSWFCKLYRAWTAARGWWPARPRRSSWPGLGDLSTWRSIVPPRESVGGAVRVT